MRDKCCMYVQIEKNSPTTTFFGFLFAARSFMFCVCSLRNANLCACCVRISQNSMWFSRNADVVVLWKFDSAWYRSIPADFFCVMYGLISLQEIHLRFQYIEFAFLRFDFGFLIEKGLRGTLTIIQYNVYTRNEIMAWARHGNIYVIL